MSEQSENRIPMLGLRRAAKDALSNLVAADAAGSSAADDFSLLIELVEHALEAEPLEQPAKPSAQLALRMRVLRRAFIEELQRSSDEDELQEGLRVLRAMDDVEEFLERDPAHRFVRHMTTSDPLGSIVALAHD